MNILLHPLYLFFSSFFFLFEGHWQEYLKPHSSNDTLVPVSHQRKLLMQYFLSFFGIELLTTQSKANALKSSQNYQMP